MDLALLADHRVKLKESEKKDEYFDLAWELKNVKHESDVYTDCDWCYWYCHQRIDKRTGELGTKKTSTDHPNYSIIEIGQNTEKIPFAERLGLTQTSAKELSVNADMKNTQRVINNNNNINGISPNSSTGQRHKH